MLLRQQMREQSNNNKVPLQPDLRIRLHFIDWNRPIGGIGRIADTS